MVEIDLIERDPHNLNNYVQVVFDDVLAEPEGAHTADCVWKNSFKCFNCGMMCCYKLMSFFCGLCMALAWGCAFGQIAFYAVWVWTPIMRLYTIILYPFRRIMTTVLSTCIGPWIETYGMIFSRIHVTTSQGEPPKALDFV